MPTGKQAREYILGKCEPALGRLGKTTALAGATNRLRDAVRYDMDTLATEEYADTYVRITSTSNSDRGLVAKVKRIDPDVGDIYFDPPAGAAIVSGATYELWRVHPDQVDRARDRALVERCSMWSLKPLSVLSEVSDWSTEAYASSDGGEQSAAGVSTALDFPVELFRKSMVITNSGADGNVASESYYPQPGQRFVLWGRVSTRAQTASVRVRNITAGSDITLEGTATFTLRGWQWFRVYFTVPAGCGELQVWLGGSSASCVSEWAGVGLLPMHQTAFSLEGRVLSEHDVAHVYAYLIPTSASGGLQRQTIGWVTREGAGNGVVLMFAAAPAMPVYYQERHRYDALQTDYLAVTDRTTGDDASTDCDLRYVAWATVVELLEGRKLTDVQARVLERAYGHLTAWERRVGAMPLVVPESRDAGPAVRMDRL